MTVTLEEHTVLPPAEPGGTYLAALAAALDPANPATLIGPDGARVTLPEEIAQVLRDVVHAMAQGLAITIAPHNTLLTTQEAAELLSISRPTLVKLLEAGRIPYQQPGRHRRIQLADLIDYQRRIRVHRRETLDEMAREAATDDAYAHVDEFVGTR